jgi:hypothetical protein
MSKTQFLICRMPKFQRCGRNRDDGEQKRIVPVHLGRLVQEFRGED